MVVPVKGHFRNGRWIAPYIRRSPGPRRSANTSPSIGEVFGGLVMVVLGLAVLGWLTAGTGHGATMPARWQSAGLSFTHAQDDTSNSCSGQSYGRVQTYLTAHPCQQVQRTLLQATDQTGQRLQVARSEVTMPTMAEAAQLKALTDQPGTGNITELRTGPPYSGTHYAAHQTGSTVIIAEAEPLDTTLNPSAANHAATQALAYPASH